MREACINAVNAVRAKDGLPDMTKAQERDIERRMRTAMTLGARSDPAKWRGLTPSERLQEGAKIAQAQLEHEVAKKEQRLALDIVKAAKLDAYLNDQVGSGRDSDKIAALDRILAPKFDGKGGAVSVEEVANGYFNDSVRRLEDVFDALRPGLFKLIPWQDPGVQKQLNEALAGITKDIDPIFIKAAKLIHEEQEQRRQAMNAEGFNIGKLETYDQSHNWSSRLANKYGEDQFVSDFMAGVDRRKYVHEDGTRFSDDEMRDFLKEAWLTRATNGENKEGASHPGGSVRANRYSAHREIHLLPEKTHELLLKYREDNVMLALVHSLRQQARDLALVQRFGTNAELQFKKKLDEAKREIAKSNPIKTGYAKWRARVTGNLYKHLAGTDYLAELKPLSDSLAFYRATKTGAVLGRAVLASITDHATMWNAALSGGVNPFKMEMNTAMAWSPKSRRYIRRLGLMTDTMIGHAQRFTSDNLTARGVSSRIASIAIRMSGLNFTTELRRAGYAVSMMDALGHLTRQSAYRDIASIKADDLALLRGKGVDQETWDIWRAAKLDRWGANHTLLTPEKIMDVSGYSELQKRRAVAKLLGVVQSETDLAVITPGVRERASMSLGLESGSPLGELAKTGLLFKSFPWTVLSRHWERAMAQGNVVGRVGYLGGLIISTTMLGIIANWLYDLFDGKEPRSINPNSKEGVKNWGQALMRGGGLGIFGDFLFNELNPGYGKSAGQYITGPALNDVDTIGQIGSAALQGNEPNAQGVTGFQRAGLKTTQLAKGLTPGASTFYLKAAFDRMVFNQLMDSIQPGYLSDLENRQYSQQHTRYWWGLDENPLAGEFPKEGPDLENAVAQ